MYHIALNYRKEKYHFNYKINTKFLPSSLREQIMLNLFFFFFLILQILRSRILTFPSLLYIKNKR